MSDNMTKQLNKYIDKEIEEKRNRYKKNNRKKTTSKELKELKDEGILEVVKQLAEMDFNKISKVKDKLKNRIIKSIYNRKEDEGELDMEELDQVAGGLNRHIDEIKKLGDLD